MDFTVRETTKILKVIMQTDIASAEALILVQHGDQLAPVGDIRGVWWHPETHEVIEAKEKLTKNPRDEGFIPGLILAADLDL